MEYAMPLRPGAEVLFLFLHADGTIRDALPTTVDRYAKRRSAVEPPKEYVVCISTRYGRRLEFDVPPSRIEHLAADTTDWSVPVVIVQDDESLRRAKPELESDSLDKLRGAIRRAARDLSNQTGPKR